MTNEERLTVDRYRRSGIGYKKISQLTGISENTIKSYCKRNGMGGAIAGNRDICPSCGKELIQMRGRKPKKFCSDHCRNKWWNSHLDLVNRKTIYEYVCPYCHKPFTVYGNAHRKYCSHECYIKDRFGGGING